MQGTRLPDAVMGEPGPGWDAFEAINPATGKKEWIAPPGAYMKVMTSGRVWCWYVCDPTGVVYTLRDNHTVTEHDDGTISVSPSIVGACGSSYHGFLHDGVWSD